MSSPAPRQTVPLPRINRIALGPVLLATVLAACAHPVVPIRTEPLVIPSGTAVVSPGAPPAVFVHSTSDVRSTRVIAVKEGLTKAAAFRAATEGLEVKHSVDVSDQRAGFLMTSWQASFVRDGIPDLRYRTRVVVRFLGDDWKQVSVKVEANWQRGDEWDVGYDENVLEAAATELTSRLAKPAQP